MKRPFVSLLLVGAVLLPGCHSDPPAVRTSPPPGPKPEEIFARAAPSVFLIRTFEENGEEIGHGSGFILEGAEQEWWGVTAQHVIGEAESAVVEMPSGEVGTVEIVRANWGRDIAFVQIIFGQEEKLEPLELHAFLPRIDSPVFCIGHPEDGEKLSAGEVSGWPIIESTQHLEITAATGHGSSGGPVLNDKGHVIGIVTGKPDGKTLAVATLEIEDVMNREDWEISELSPLP